MNANRLINMVFRMLMRYGLKHLSKGQKPDANTQAAKQAAKIAQRNNRL